MKPLIIIAIPISFFVLLACQKDLSVETGSNSLSVGTLKDSLGDCYPFAIGGAYIEDQNLTAANYVDVTVTVSAAGKYRIATDTMNGFWFIDSGFFSAPGTFVVRLKGGGKPILPIRTDFIVEYGLSFCNFNITPAASTGTGSLNSADTAWMFSKGTFNFKGHVDSALVKNTATGVFLRIYGKPATNDTTFYVQLLQNTPSPTGTYSTSNGTAVFEFKTPAGNTIYDSRQTDGSDIIFTITNFNTTTRVMDATFTGTAKDAGGGTTTITSGKLKLQVQ